MRSVNKIQCKIFKCCKRDCLDLIITFRIEVSSWLLGGKEEMISSSVKTEDRAEQCLNVDLGINCPHPNTVGQGSRQSAQYCSSSSVTCCACACVRVKAAPAQAAPTTERYHCGPLSQLTDGGHSDRHIDLSVALSLPGWVDSMKPQACSLSNWPQTLPTLSTRCSLFASNASTNEFYQLLLLL